MILRPGVTLPGHTGPSGGEATPLGKRQTAAWLPHWTTHGEDRL